MQRIVQNEPDHPYTEDEINIHATFTKIKRQSIQRIEEWIASSKHKSLTEILKLLKAEMQKVTMAPFSDTKNEEAYLGKYLEKLAARIIAARNAINSLPSVYRFLQQDKELQILQLHLQNHAYYQSLGVRYFDTTMREPKWDYNQYSSYEIHESDITYLHDDLIRYIDYFAIVYVSAPPPNPYGHVLLLLGDVGFLHINALHDQPHFIPMDQFNHYLASDQRYVLGIQHINVPNLEDAKNKLRELNQTPWFWRMYWDNCANFADAILKAGGVSYADINPQHVGQYHDRTQYPNKRIRHLHPTQLNFRLQASLQRSENLVSTRIPNSLTEMKASSDGYAKTPSNEFHHQLFFAYAKKSGLNDDESKEYVRYRMEEGYSHSKAQYKASPSLLHFFISHASTIGKTLTAPLYFLAALPIFAKVGWMNTKSLVSGSSCSLFCSGKKNENKTKEETRPLYRRTNS